MPSPAFPPMNTAYIPTPRQGVIIEHLTHGMTTKEIAAAEGRSQKTIANQIAHLYTRLGIHTNTGVVSWYWRKRVAELEARVAHLEGGAK